MSRIRSEDTQPEKVVRSILYRLGFRFRLHDESLPGKPDIVLRKYKTVIFVHGCFWHRHQKCKYAYIPKTKTDFWNKKFSENIARDEKIRKELEEQGWKVLIIWECGLSNQAALHETSQRLANLKNKNL
jgi:DNA mismatch endonuclease (patch repair protein)